MESTEYSGDWTSSLHALFSTCFMLHLKHIHFVGEIIDIHEICQYYKCSCTYLLFAGRAHWELEEVLFNKSLYMGKTWHRDELEIVPTCSTPRCFTEVFSTHSLCKHYWRSSVQMHHWESKFQMIFKMPYLASSVDHFCSITLQDLCTEEQTLSISKDLSIHSKMISQFGFSGDLLLLFLPHISFYIPRNSPIYSSNNWIVYIHKAYILAHLIFIAFSK